MEFIHPDPFWMATHMPVGLLVLARVSGVCMTAPVTAVTGIDWYLRLGLSLMIGVVLIPVLEPLIGSLPAGPGLVWLALLELLMGGLLGLSAGLIVAASRQAGDIVAAQAGLSASVLLDPETGDELTPLGRFYGLIALAVFLAMQGPLVLVRVLIESYRVIPAGGLALNEGTVSQVFSQVSGALALSLRAAAPVTISLVVAGIVIGWIGRLAPAVPFLALSLPARSLLGILLVFLGLGNLAMTFSQAWTGWPWGP